MTKDAEESTESRAHGHGRQDICLGELEGLLGIALPPEYRAFLIANADKLMEPELEFRIPNGPSGIVTYLYTACDLVKRSAQNRLGDPARGMMAIGADQMGGYVYMCVSDTALGRVYCRDAYGSDGFIELASSFAEFYALCSPVEEGPDD